MRNIFDSHAHYDDRRFDPDREDLLESLPDQGVRYVFNAGSDLASSEMGIRLTQQYGYFYCGVGIHPHEAKDAPRGYLKTLEQLSKEAKVQAIGEIGLDYHYDFSPREIQLQVFEEQLELAGSLDLPVVIHDREAHADTMELLKKHRPRGIVHCYSGSTEMARELVELGLYIGFTGVVTFKNARRALEAVAVIPEDRLLVETDCPYMAPEPYRGKRCDSAMIPQTAEVLARLKGMDLQAMLDLTCENACRVYGVTKSR